MNKTNKLKRLTMLGAVIAAVLLAGFTARAENYVLTYTTGGTTYFLARNGTSGVQRVTAFDPTTCIWSCASNTSGTTASTLGNSNRYLFQTVNGTRYFLNYDLGFTATTANNNCRVRSGNNGVYFYNSYRYIILSGTNPTYSTSTTTGAAKAYTVSNTAAYSNTVTGDMTVTPSSYTLESGTVTLTASASITQTVQTRAEYWTIGTSPATYCVSGGTPATTTPQTTETTSQLSYHHFNWSGTTDGYFTISDYYSASQNTTTLTRETLKSDITRTYTITVTGAYGPSQIEKTAQATITIPPTYVDIDGISCNPLTVAYGTTGHLVINSWISGTGAPYLNLTYSTDDATIATVASDGTVTGTGIGTTYITIQSIKMDGTNGPSVTATVTVTPAPLAAPKITISSGGEVTLTDMNDPSVNPPIYYTTDGSDPSSSATRTLYSGTTFTVSNLTVVRAVAIGDGSNYVNSAIAQKQHVVSGISNNQVILNDLEDHEWSYYSDASLPDQLHSLNPADVIIKYYGNGNNVSTSNDAAPALNTFTASSNNAVKVGIDADAHTFIYYRTVERENPNGTGLCPYTTIPNPFSVRPTYGSGDTRWRGFYAWRIKTVSGGTINGKNVGDTINAESTVLFSPSGEYGMTVELEALWARMYVGSGYQASVGYERNFVVGGAAVNYPATYSALYPNGSTDGGTTLATSVTGTYDPGGARTLSYDTKFEYINLTGNRTYTANNHYLCFGRGISTANNAGTVQGINGGATNLNYELRVESGQFSAFCFVRSGTSTTVSGRYFVKALMGCDYDRATGTNNRLLVSANSTLYFSQIVTFSGTSNIDQKTFDCVFKSGTYQSSHWTESAQSGTNGYQHIAYLGPNQASNGTCPGMRCVTVEGGDLGGMCGGRGVGGTSTDYMTPEVITFDLRIKGGTFHGGVFGGAADNPSIGSRRFIMTGGEIWGWLAGGCNGTGSQTGSGATDGDSYIYVGGHALVGGDHAMCIQETNGGQVFGAGRGLNDTRASSVNHSNVVIADEAVITNNNNNTSNPVGGNVYGGSYNGTVVTESNVYILGGTVEKSVFGGSYGNAIDIPAANVTMTGGQVTDGVYGGSNSKGTVGTVTMNINGGTVGNGNDGDGVFGGGYGQPTIVSGNVDITVGVQNTTGVTVNGDVYGGSALGSVNGTSANTTYHTNVTLNAGTINGSLYGGALGSNSVAANVYSPVAVTVNGGSVNKTSADGSGAVYGCNNISGAPQRAVAVVINGTDAPTSGYALDAIYGGGNRADYTYGTPTVTVNNCDNSIEYVYGGGNAASVPATDVTIYGGNTIGNVFGGGNGTVSPANVTGNTLTKIYGGTIGRVFGGSNSQGSIGGTIKVRVNKTGSCLMKIGELYGGGNMADSKVGSIDIGCTGDYVSGNSGHAHCNETDNRIGYELEGIGDVYGGANAAEVTGDVTLTIDSGMVYRVFGNNNTADSVTGTITVNIDKKDDACGWYVGYVYGGGNQAPYSVPNESDKYPAVYIKNGLVSYHVFGGGLGSTAKVTGNPTVTLDGTAEVGGNVYGGGNAAAVKGNTKVTLKD